MKIILFLLITFACFGCCPADEPREINLEFNLIDESGQDLFFGQGAKYDPKDAKVDVLREDGNNYGYCNLYVTPSNFNLVGDYPLENTEYVYVFEFIPERADTIRFNNVRYYNTGFCGNSFFHIDAYFNGELLCADCSGIKTYKIELK